MKRHLSYYLLLGGNLGNEHVIFSEARHLIQSQVGTINQVSGLYRSPAWGFNSNDFINQAIHLKSIFYPEQVIDLLLKIEAHLGRIRQKEHASYQDRSIDIDILLVNEMIINTEKLTVPHPRMCERKFALLPLNEIGAQLIHPVKNQRISTLLANCPDNSKVEIIRS